MPDGNRDFEHGSCRERQLIGDSCANLEGQRGADTSMPSGRFDRKHRQRRMSVEFVAA